MSNPDKFGIRERLVPPLPVHVLPTPLIGVAATSSR